MRIERGGDGSIRRALASRPARARLALAGIATSTLMVVVLFATYRNLTRAVDRYAGQTAIDLWVAPRGTDNLIRSSALLPEAVAPGIASVPGVRRADPILRGFVTVEPTQGASRSLAFLAMGYRAPNGLGSPASLAAGRLPRRSGEIVLDRAAAHRIGVGPGATVRVNGERSRVVGLSRDTNLLATQLVFVDADSAARANGFGARVSLVAVALEPGADADAVKRSIEQRFPGVVAHRREHFVESNRREVAAGFRPVLFLVSLVGMCAGALLVALLVHGLVDDRRADLAVLLALGASPTVLARAVVTHAVSRVVSGAALGATFALGLARALDRFMPTVGLVVHASDVVAIAIAFGFIASLAACGPLLRLRSIEPVEAFRS